MNFLYRLILLTLLPLLFSTGCSSFLAQEQPSFTETAIFLQAGQNLGQTFVARDRGLEGVEIYLAPEGQSSAEIRLHLRASPQSATDLAVATISAQNVIAPGFYRFAFSPQSDSLSRVYYLLLEIQGAGKVRLGT